MIVKLIITQHPMLKTLFWNIRGINKNSAISRLKILKKQYDLKLVSICEPHLNASRLEEIKLKIGYTNAIRNNANRIWIFFDDSLAGNITSQSDQYIAIKFSIQNLYSEFLAIFVHGHCSADDRRSLWHDLSLVVNENIPCILLGDFNVIMSANEKRGGIPFNINEAEDFINFISDTSLLDVGFSGSPFTWCNNRSTNARIWKRLDRVLVDPLWLNSGVNTSVLHLARVGSDHAPLLISHGSQESSHRAFRFLNFWSSHSDFLQEVNKSWNEQTYGSPIVNLMMKLKRLKSHLKNWSWEAFGNILEAAKKAERQKRTSAI